MMNQKSIRPIFGSLAILLAVTGLTACKPKQRPLPVPPPVTVPSDSGSADRPPTSIDPTAPRPVLTLRLEPSRVPPGESALLSWEALHADRVWIDHEIGAVVVSGRIKLFPQQTTTYRVTAEGAGGRVEETATIEVGAAGDSSGLEADDPGLPLEQRFTAAVKPIFFAFDSSELSQQALLTLDGNIRWLSRPENSGIDFVIEGHCDERGSQEYNLALGDRRAQVVRNYLVRQGISESRLVAVSLGEERPMVDAESEEQHALNRRAQFVLLGGER